MLKESVLLMRIKALESQLRNIPDSVQIVQAEKRVLEAKISYLEDTISKSVADHKFDYEMLQRY